MVYPQVDVPNLVPGDVVRVLDDAEKVMNLQLSVGVEWTEDVYDVSNAFSYQVTTTKHYCFFNYVCQCIGKIGRIKALQSGVLSVVVGCKEFLLSSLCVQQESNEQLLAEGQDTALNDKQYYCDY